MYHLNALMDSASVQSAPTPLRSIVQSSDIHLAIDGSQAREQRGMLYSYAAMKRNLLTTVNEIVWLRDSRLASAIASGSEHDLSVIRHVPTSQSLA
jgi:hypothetical protein